MLDFSDFKQMGKEFLLTIWQNKLLFLTVGFVWVLLLTRLGDVNFLSFLPALDAKYPCLFRLGMC